MPSSSVASYRCKKNTKDFRGEASLCIPLSVVSTVVCGLDSQSKSGLSSSQDNVSVSGQSERLLSDLFGEKWTYNEIVSAIMTICELKKSKPHIKNARNWTIHCTSLVPVSVRSLLYWYILTVLQIYMQNEHFFYDQTVALSKNGYKTGSIPHIVSLCSCLISSLLDMYFDCVMNLNSKMNIF